MRIQETQQKCSACRRKRNVISWSNGLYSKERTSRQNKCKKRKSELKDPKSSSPNRCDLRKRWCFPIISDMFSFVTAFALSVNYLLLTSNQAADTPHNITVRTRSCAELKKGFCWLSALWNWTSVSITTYLHELLDFARTQRMAIAAATHFMKIISRSARQLQSVTADQFSSRFWNGFSIASDPSFG